MITDHRNHKVLYSELIPLLHCDVIILKVVYKPKCSLYTSVICRYLSLHSVFFRLKKSQNIGLHAFIPKMDKDLAKKSPLDGLTSSWVGGDVEDRPAKSLF